MMQLMLIVLPASMLGLLAVALAFMPKTAIASETAATVTKATTAAAYAGAGVPVFLGYTVDEWSAIGVFGGLILGALTWIGNMVVNAYFKREHLKLAIRQAEAGQPILEDEA
jgi:hypothetical protein